MQIEYPLVLEFKKIALTNKVTMTSSNGLMLLYAHQKMLKLKEQIFLYSDKEKNQPLGQIRADRVIDFSPRFTYFDTNEQAVLSVKRNGKRSIWKADYSIIDSNEHEIFHVREDNPWTKVLDVLVREIPIVGMFTGYFLNPKYNITNAQGTRVAQITKKPSFLESSYDINLELPSDPHVSYLPISSLAILLRERFRG